jgi:hypothetical protein
MSGSRIKILFIVVLLILASASSFSQSPGQGREKYTLLTTPYNIRPLSLYRGQFQVNTGYKFAIRTQSYNSDGDIIFLTNTGTGSVYHYYFINLTYGVTDFLELAAETNFVRRGVRSESTTYVSTTVTSSDRINVNSLTEVRGMGDILLLATLRLPLKYRWFDLSTSGGMYLPSSRYEPAKPTSSVTDITAPNSYTVNNHYNYANGYGVPVYLFSPSIKVTFRKFSLETSLAYKTPMKEGNNIRWEETLTENRTFSYYDKTYKYLLSDAYSINSSVHYQATGWFDISLNGSFQKTAGGWTEYWGNKYENKETRLFTLEPGFEIQISPSLRILQVAGFPVKGMNSDAPFYIFTTIRYSNFPFLR